MGKFTASLWIVLAVFLVACTSEPETLEGIFDGNECTYSGPTELVTGDHSFVFKDLSDQQPVVRASRILNGYTYQDMLDLQSEPGEYFSAPAWIRNLRRLSLDWDASIGAEVYTWRFDEEGEHYLIVNQPTLPRGRWFCTSLQIVADPDE